MQQNADGASPARTRSVARTAAPAARSAAMAVYGFMSVSGSTWREKSRRQVALAPTAVEPRVGRDTENRRFGDGHGLRLVNSHARAARRGRIVRVHRIDLRQGAARSVKA